MEQGIGTEGGEWTGTEGGQGTGVKKIRTEGEGIGVTRIGTEGVERMGDNNTERVSQCDSRSNIHSNHHNKDIININMNHGNNINHSSNHQHTTCLP